MDAAKTELLTTFLLDFLEYLRASEGEAMVHKKVICHDLCPLHAAPLLHMSFACHKQGNMFFCD